MEILSTSLDLMIASDESDLVRGRDVSDSHTSSRSGYLRKLGRFQLVSLQYGDDELEELHPGYGFPRARSLACHSVKEIVLVICGGDR